MSTHHQLSEAIERVINDARKAGALIADAPESVPLERPKNREHGDYATSIALALAKSAGKPPREIAELIATGLRLLEIIDRVDIAGPGFINITLAKATQGAIVINILENNVKFGIGNELAGVKVNLEFISANPTGPLHLGHTRWAAVGDALARVLSAAGAEVSREFYINDRGVQMDLFGESLRASALGIAKPEAGYQGGYIDELAKKIVVAEQDLLKLSEPESLVAFREAGYKLQLQEQKDVLAKFGTNFQVWFSERSLHAGERVAGEA